MGANLNIDELNVFIKRLNIFQTFPSIYNAVSGTNSYGIYGTLIRNNIVEAMRREFRKREFWEVDCPIISPTDIWKASGHMDRFKDIIATSDNKTFRVEKVVEETRPDINLTERGLEGIKNLVARERIIPHGCSEPLHDVREYSLMVLSSIADSPVALRPETATTTYIDFPSIHQTLRGHMPVKVFQYGKAFRNEITSRRGLIRGREFEQFEAQMFIFEDQKNPFDEFNNGKGLELSILDIESQKRNVPPKIMSLNDAVSIGILPSEAMAYCFNITSNILTKTGIDPSTVRFRQHLPDEKAHYAIDAWDVEVRTQQYGLVEFCGVHDRGNYDLTRHQEFSGKKLEVQHPDGSHQVPHILEIAFGVGRSLYCALEQNFRQRGDTGYNILSLPRKISPIHVAVFPLVNKDGLEDIAYALNGKLSDQGFISVFDKKGSIGKRYARMDEIGTPFCITIDYQTKEDDSVTIRERDTKSQTRIKIADLTASLYAGLNDTQ